MVRSLDTRRQAWYFLNTPTIHRHSEVVYIPRKLDFSSTNLSSAELRSFNNCKYRKHISCHKINFKECAFSSFHHHYTWLPLNDPKKCPECLITVISFILLLSIFVDWQKLRCLLTFEFMVLILVNDFSCYLCLSLCTKFRGFD